MATPLPPRGIRNNNPLNLRRSNDNWQGLRTEQNDPDFFQFISVWFGIRAAFICMRTHVNRDSKALIRTTVKREISRWAPPTENNTAAYIKAVCEKANILDDCLVDFSKKNLVCRLLWAMSFVENGQDLPFNYFETSYEMAFNPAYRANNDVQLPR